MVASRLLMPLAMTALAAALLLPAASAHTVSVSGDGKVRAVIGQLNEPVSTYAVSGLDICFSDNTTASHPAIASVDLGALTATLRSPGGQTLSQALKNQFGRPGCVTFTEPYVLTQPGQYVVDLGGKVANSTFALTGIAAGGAVVDRADITFPDSGVASNLALETRVAALEHKVDALSASAASTPTPTQKSPAPVAAYLMAALAVLAAVRRMR